MPQKLLHRPNIIAIFQQVCGKTVTQSVTASVLVDTGCFSKLVDMSGNQLLTHSVGKSKKLRCMPHNTACSRRFACGSERLMPTLGYIRQVVVLIS